MTLACVAFAASWIAACGGGDDHLPHPLLEGVDASSALAPHLEASLRRLSGPDRGDPAVVRDLTTYDDVLQGIYTRDERSAASDRLFALWRANPGHVLWPELAVRERRFLRGFDRSDEIFASAVCADTTTAIGAYMLAWKLRTLPALTTQFQIARGRAADLDAFSALWIELKAAFGERIAGRPEASVDIALASLPRAGEVGGRRLEALFWLEVARAEMAGGELDDALHAAAVADTLYASAIPEGGSIAGLLSIRETLADVLAARRDTAAALARYEANIDAAARLGLGFLASRDLNRAGMLAEEVGDRPLGLDYCRRGLAFALSDQDSLSIPRHLMNIARRFRMQGDLDSCLVYQTRAERWIAAYPDPSNLARMPLMQAEYYAQVGKYDVVDSLLSAAAARSKDKSTLEARAELHLELIRGWMETGRPDLVYRSLEAIEDLRAGVGDIYADRHVSADLNLLIGEFLTYRGEYARADESLKRAAAALEQRTSPSRAWTLARNRGLLARERGDLAVAEGAFRSCIDIGLELGNPAQESTGRLLLGSVLLASKRYAEARETFPSTDAASFVGRFTTRVLALLLTGISYRREGNHDLALASLAEAKQACRSWTPPDLRARIDLEAGRALADAGRITRARQLYDGVAALLESGAGADATPELAYFNGDLRRDLVEAVIGLPDAEPAATLHLARRVLPRWRPGFSEAGDRLAFPQIVFFVGEEASGRWTVDERGVRWTPLPGEPTLDGLLAPVLADLSVPGRAVATDDVQRLGTLLLAGLDDVWRGERTLVIVPELALFRVPWASLPWPGGGAMVVDRGAVAICDMPAVERGQYQAPRSPGRMLVVGTDGYAGTKRAGLATLRHAEAEARQVAAAWPVDRATLCVGPTAALALEDDASLGGFQVIHVASHARVFTGRADQTMLLLAGDGGDALTAKKIQQLDLDADLVFLSCCEAGDGRDTRSGYAGLARSFLDAGARSVVAPLTVIDDEAAKELAIRFYSHWRADRSVPDALRATQLDLRDGDPRWSHPFYWAFYLPFVSQMPDASR